MDRRRFLKGMMSAGLLLAGGVGLPGRAQAAADGRVLVVLFMRGGWDGLNVTVPYGEDAYHSARPNLRIAAPSASDAQSALDLDGFFGFHPSLAPLHRMYHEGQVAVLPAVHYPNATRSHFEGQDIMEDAASSPVTSGWLARYLSATSGNGVSQRVLSLTQDVPRSLRGPLPVAAYSDLGAMYLSTSWKDQKTLTNLMASEYSRPPLAGNDSAEMLNGMGLQLLTDIVELSAVNALPVDGGAVYPSTTLGRQMRQAAGLIKSRAGLEIITLDFGGWDTHRGQGAGKPEGAMSQLLGQFAQSTEAFFKDLGGDASRVTLLVASEFGRTVAENGSTGTDHGNATTWMLVGGGVAGGIYNGAGWPTLAVDKLNEGRYLAHTIDYRDVYAECLKQVLGLGTPSTVLLGHSPKSVGCLA